MQFIALAVRQHTHASTIFLSLLFEKPRLASHWLIPLIAGSSLTYTCLYPSPYWLNSPDLLPIGWYLSGRQFMAQLRGDVPASIPPPIGWTAWTCFLLVDISIAGSSWPSWGATYLPRFLPRRSAIRTVPSSGEIQYCASAYFLQKLSTLEQSFKYCLLIIF